MRNHNSYGSIVCFRYEGLISATYGRLLALQPYHPGHPFVFTAAKVQIVFLFGSDAISSLREKFPVLGIILYFRLRPEL